VNSTVRDDWRWGRGDEYSSVAFLRSWVFGFVPKVSSEPLSRRTYARVQVEQTVIQSIPMPRSPQHGSRARGVEDGNEVTTFLSQGRGGSQPHRLRERDLVD
jgi:hypothetical protein